jgi:hypothetical protein
MGLLDKLLLMAAAAAGTESETGQRYWVDDDGDGLWNNSNNWAYNDGGSGGKGVPTSDKDVFFTSSQTSNCRLDAAIDIASLTMQAGYTGTIDGDTDDLNHAVSGDVTLDGTRVDMGGGTWTVAGHFDNKDVNDFNHNNGTLKLTGAGSGTQSITTLNKALGNVTVNDAGATKNVVDDLTCDNFVMTAGEVDPNGNTFTISGNCTWGASSTLTLGGLTGSQWDITGDFSADTINLEATAIWTLNVAGTGTAQNLEVRYSNALGGSEIQATDCHDRGNNDNWSFSEKEVLGNILEPVLRDSADFLTDIIQGP